MSCWRNFYRNSRKFSQNIFKGTLKKYAKVIRMTILDKLFGNFPKELPKGFSSPWQKFQKQLKKEFPQEFSSLFWQNVRWYSKRVAQRFYFHKKISKKMSKQFVERISKGNTVEAPKVITEDVSNIPKTFSKKSM